jgi:hypothetical protein
MKSVLQLSNRLLRTYELPRRPTTTAVWHYRGIITETLNTDEMGKDKEKSSVALKVPKGTKDWDGKDMVIRDKIFSTITSVFKRHGAVTIDTLVNLPSPVAQQRLADM